MSECVLLIRVGPTVVTKADQLAVLHPSPFPPGSCFTTSALATMFGRAPSTIRVALHRLADKLDPPRYYQRRHRGDFRLRRLTTEHDVSVLAAYLVVSLKATPVKKNLAVS